MMMNIRGLVFDNLTSAVGSAQSQSIKFRPPQIDIHNGDIELGAEYSSGFERSQRSESGVDWRHGRPTD